MERQNTAQIKGRDGKKRALAIVLLVVLLGAAAVFCINAHMVLSVRGRILTEEQAAGLDADCILVLGAGLSGNGRPSTILADRLDYALRLYEAGASDRLLMSGDHSRVDYDEVTAMKAYAMERGAASSDIFLDHAGFSTYESVYRARDVFQAERVIIVTQGYHLYRALYIADRLGLEAYGVASDARGYARQPIYTAREIAARCKDFFYTVAEPKPTYLGRVIPVSGNGDTTNSSTPRPIRRGRQIAISALALPAAAITGGRRAIAPFFEPPPICAHRL